MGGARESRQLWSDFSAGLAVGSLIGLILGLSVSPVAGTVMGALVALLAAFLGLRPTSEKDGEKDEEAAPPTRGRLPALRITGFGLGAIVALLGGLYLRAHGVFSPSPQAMVARWVEAQFPPEQARMLAAYELAGTLPAETNKAVAPAAAMPGIGAAGARLSVLFADDVDTCNELSKPFESGAAAVKAWKSYRGVWEAVASQVEKTREPAKQMQALEAIHPLLCRDQ